MHRDGHEFPIELSVSAINTGGAIEFNAFIRDITMRKLADEEIQQLAFYDPLTKLPNRRLLMDRLQQALAANTRGGEHGALLFIDWTTSKHSMTASTRHRRPVAPASRTTAYRLCARRRYGSALGGDEFVVMLGDLSENSREAAFQSETIGEKFLPPSISLTSLPVTMPQHPEHRHHPVCRTPFFPRRSNKTGGYLHVSGQESRAQHHPFFDPDVQAAVTARALLETDLRHALDNSQLQLYYGCR